MTEEEVYTKIKIYFSVQEFVTKKTYDKYGEKSWQFLCPRMLHTILVIRMSIGKKITINNWLWGGIFSQRGLRTNIGQIVLKMVQKKRLYLSAHVMGKAIDFDVEGMSANEVRNWIVDNQDLLPYKVRLENKMNGKYINWVHLDVFYYTSNKKVYLFNV